MLRSLTLFVHHLQSHRLLILITIHLAVSHGQTITTINKTTPIVRTVIQRIDKWGFDPISGSFFAAEFTNYVAKFDSGFSMIWEKNIVSPGGWNAGIYAGVHSITVLPTGGRVLVVGTSLAAVNGVAMQVAGNSDIFYLSTDSATGDFVYTKMAGGTSWDAGNDIAISSADENFFYIVGAKTGNYITAAPTGNSDPFIIKVRVTDGVIVWRTSVAPDNSYDMANYVAEVNNTVVQLLMATSNVCAGTWRLLSFDVGNGAFLEQVATLPFSGECVFAEFDYSSGYWMTVRQTGRQFVVLDTSARPRFTWNISATPTLVPTAFAFDSFRFNLFIAYQGTNMLSIAQIGILSGQIHWNSWIPAAITDSITSMKIVRGNLLVGGTNFARFFPNVTYQDSCADDSVMMPLWTCQQCPSGTYVQNNTCTACPFGSYCPEGSRISCGPNSNTSSPASFSQSSCICNPGYYGSNGVCIICPQGTYCPGGSSIHACSPNSNTSSSGAFSQSSCICNPGYYGSNGACIICPQGTYCPGGSSIHACGPNSNTSSSGSFSQSSCICNPGYYGSNGVCIICPQGTYCPGGGLTAVPCGDNSHTISQGSQTAMQCLCDAGFFGSNGACQSCAQGFFQPLAGQARCRPCPTFSADCRATSFSCLPGYTMTSIDNCTLCETGHFKYLSGNGPCQTCPQNAVSCNATGYQCASGYDESSNLCLIGQSNSPKAQNSSNDNWWIRNTLIAPIIYGCAIMILLLIGVIAGFMSGATSSLPVSSYYNERPPMSNRRPRNQSATIRVRRKSTTVVRTIESQRRSGSSRPSSQRTSHSHRQQPNLHMKPR